MTVKPNYSFFYKGEQKKKRDKKLSRKIDAPAVSLFLCQNSGGYFVLKLKEIRRWNV